jgi:hypothetical protein
MKYLLLMLALSVGLFAAPNDLILSQAKNPGPGNIQVNVPAQNAITSASLPSFQSGIGLGTEDSPSFTSLTLSATSTALLYIATSNTTTYSATTDIVMTKTLQTVTLTGNITFTTSAKAAGQYVTVRVVGDGSNRTLTFPGTWVWVGSVAPSTLLASKVGVLSLICFGSNDSDVVASWVSSL